MTRLKFLKSLNLLILNSSFLILFAACSVDEPLLGSIMFTSNQDCDIRLFDAGGAQIARINYEIGKEPAIVQMTRSGIFIVHAVGETRTIKDPITFVNGNLEYYIEF